MQTIELLKIRSFSEADKKRAIALFNTLQMNGQNLPRRVRLFSSQNPSTDLTVCLCWDTPPQWETKSDFAFRLAAALKHCGWISHTSWNPIREMSS